MGFSFELYGPLSPNIISSLLVIIALSILAISIGHRIDKLDPKETPKGFTLAMVFIVDTFNNFIKQHLTGNRYKVFGPYLFSILMYLVFANTISLFGLNPPLANIGVAASFSIMTFFLLKATEIRYQGLKNKLVSLLGVVKPIAPIMLPINLIGEFSSPITMGMRLFGNLMSGMVISIMIYSSLQWYFSIFAGVFVHAIFDIFFGLIQAFVFFMLSTISLSMASNTD